jgi:hypothetical protein
VFIRFYSPFNLRLDLLGRVGTKFEIGGTLAVLTTVESAGLSPLAGRNRTALLREASTKPLPFEPRSLLEVSSPYRRRQNQQPKETGLYIDQGSCQEQSAKVTELWKTFWYRHLELQNYAFIAQF